MDQSKSLQKKETTLDHDLQSGNKTDAAVSLLHEMNSNPQEALALIQREQARHASSGNKDQLHLGVQSNGDVFVWNKAENEGYYAGTVPAALRAQLNPAQPTESAADCAAGTQSGHDAAQAQPAPAAVEQAAVAGAAAGAAAVQEQPAAGPQSYEYQQPHHKGFHIPLPIDIGVHNGSFHFGINLLGLVKGGVSLGAENRGYVGSDALKTTVSAGVDLNNNHIGPAANWRVLGGAVTAGSARVGIDPNRNGDGANIGGGADASAFGRNVGAGGHGGLEVGQKFGPHADAYSYVGPAEANANGYANLSDRGLTAGGNVNAGAEPVVGVHAQGRVGVGAKNQAHADVGANVGDNGGSVGAGFYPQAHPDVYAQGWSGNQSAGVGLNPLRAWSRTDDQ